MDGGWMYNTLLDVQGVGFESIKKFHVQGRDGPPSGLHL